MFEGSEAFLVMDLTFLLRNWITKVGKGEEILDKAGVEVEWVVFSLGVNEVDNDIFLLLILSLSLRANQYMIYLLSI